MHNEDFPKGSLFLQKILIWVPIFVLGSLLLYGYTMAGILMTGVLGQLFTGFDYVFMTTIDGYEINADIDETTTDGVLTTP